MFINLKKFLFFDAVIPFLAINPKERIVHTQKPKCTLKKSQGLPWCSNG